jgi:uncharacterized MnhB-related membrane protein
MIYLIFAIAGIFCAYQVMRASRLLNVTIWLALTSAVVSILIYMLGAPELAVIELSVGAGLVTVLFVFAFSIVGEATFDDNSIVPKALVWALTLGIAFILGWFVMPVKSGQVPAEGITFARTLWHERGLDVIAQIVLIFSGVMGLLGLLSQGRAENLVASATAKHSHVDLASMQTLPASEDSIIDGKFTEKTGLPTLAPGETMQELKP